MEEISEERSGDHGAPVDDDPSTAPVPEKVRRKGVRTGGCDDDVTLLRADDEAACARGFDGFRCVFRAQCNDVKSVT